VKNLVRKRRRIKHTAPSRNPNGVHGAASLLQTATPPNNSKKNTAETKAQRNKKARRPPSQSPPNKSNVPPSKKDPPKKKTTLNNDNQEWNGMSKGAQLSIIKEAMKALVDQAGADMVKVAFHDVVCIDTSTAIDTSAGGIDSIDVSAAIDTSVVIETRATILNPIDTSAATDTSKTTLNLNDSLAAIDASVAIETQATIINSIDTSAATDTLAATLNLNDTSQTIESNHPAAASETPAPTNFNSNDVFALRSDGFFRLATAARVAKHRAVQQIVDSIKKAGVNGDQRCVALQTALIHEGVANISNRIGLLQKVSDQKALNELIFCFEQLRKIYKVAKSKDKARGRTTESKDLFIETLVTGIVATNKEEMRDPRRPGYKRLAKLFDQPVENMRNVIRHAQKKRSLLFDQQNCTPKLWSTLLRGKKKIKTALSRIIPKVVEWVRTHPNVIPSPQMKDTLLINGQRVGKLLLEIPVRELHKLKKATDSHKQMCGCEICVVARLMLLSLKAWRENNSKKLNANASSQIEKMEAKKYTDFVASAPTKLSEAIKEVLCKPVEECNGHHKWPCVLQKCDDCPEYAINEHENMVGDNAPTINFNFYVAYHKCSVHRVLPAGTKTCSQCESLPDGSTIGKVRSDKKLTVINKPIGTFMTEYYIPMIKKCAYHIPHVKMLSGKECGKMRRDAQKNEPYSFWTGHDYTERLTPNFNFEIQGDHFNKDRSLSMEGYGVSVFPANKLTEYEEGTITDEQLATAVRKEYHSFFSDDSKQDAVTTHNNMEKLFLSLLERRVTRKKATNWDNTDGCAKQYRCGTALFMLTILAMQLGIVIDRAIGAPGHGKSDIDGLMAVDKVFLRSLFRMILIPEAREGEKRFNAATMKDGKETSLATQCVKVCSDPSRVNGVKSNNKHSKREEARVIKLRKYYESTRNDVQCKDLKAAVVNGFDTGPRNGLSAMYNIRADPELGAGQIAVRRIPCACIGCLNRFERLIKERYTGTCTECKYHSIFLGTNDWKIVTLAAKSNCPDEDLEEAKMIVLESMAENAASEVKIGNVGAFSTEDPAYEGFYLVEWTSLPFKAQEDHYLHEYEPPMFIKKGDLLAKAKYTVRVQQILVANIKLLDHSASNPLPRTCNRNDAIRLGSKKLNSVDHDRILHLILVRNVLDFEEREESQYESGIDDESDGSLDEIEDLSDTDND